MTDTPVLELLAANSRADGDCIIWTGALTKKGYGRICLGGKQPLVHRVAWIARYGEPPADKPCVLHRCDNRPCFKEGHLFVGTRAENNADRDAKGRQARPVTGERHHRARFTDADIAVIRRRRASGWLLRELAAEYGGSTSYISAIVRGLAR